MNYIQEVIVVDRYVQVINVVETYDASGKCGRRLYICK